VPDFPRPEVVADAQRLEQAAGALSPPDSGADAATQWANAIDTLFVQYTAERAARSLREAEQVRQLASLRRAQAHTPR